jgi:S-adenosylmethionine:tRNA-ribosyltransferase-isomerase (queuine synthetase)
MKKLLLFSLVALAIGFAACDKGTTLPPYTPPVATNFSVKTLAHTKDTVNVGDTIYLTATGTMSDTIGTESAVYTYMTVSYTISGANVVYNYGSAASPVKIARTIGANTNGQFAWTATVPLYGATSVPHKTKLTIAANFQYQSSFSSVQGALSAADAGVKLKTVFVQ